MAAATLCESGLEEGEYESDSDGTSALALRRREASDDEEREVPASSSHHSFSDEDAEEGEGTPPDDGEDDDEEKEGAALLRRRRLVSEEEDDHEGLHHQEGGSRKSADKEDGSQGSAAAGTTDGKEAGEEDKKEAEPFVVPTAGAFYMHDDRSRGVGGARPRRGVGGSRKLWEAKDEKPWVHDLFEELNVRDDSYSDEGLSRGGRGRSRGRGRVNRDRNRGWVGKLASDSEELNASRARRGRGRGRPARSEVVEHNRLEESAPSTSMGTHDGAGSSNVRVQDESTKDESSAPPRKVVAGSLNSASPPFFPSSALQPKSVEVAGSVQVSANQITGGRDRARRPGSQVSVAKTGSSGRGPQVGGELQSSAHDQQPVKPSTAQTTPPDASSSSQGHVLLPSLAQQSQAQEAEAPGPITQVSAGSIPVNVGQSAQSGRPKSTGGRGGTTHVVGGRGGSFVYHGGPAAVMNNGVQKVDQGFASPIPAVGPVAVQYGGHPSAGIALPAVGMAMPNYTSQPQFGFPNSEVTWIPVLAGGGTLGAGYATPYMTMEGTPSPIYFNQPASFRPAGRGISGAKPSGLWKPPPNQELGPDEFGHRQNKARRYSEMSFGH
ncbi:protein MLN51 homolog isoform X2 [Physcomitrium patens]|uniref:Btz domain-containing protein n=1 Tax=Physcomitrium patens TaxID=3218 RepID=A0A7I4B9S7_PHYPA|nr:protein MLN51 homolog isoform X2 [Physcomitrium patens]|eukprot:XP_024400494.1 protein MLN51 homolog isoform X2 [Physcomitrella patens]